MAVYCDVCGTRADPAGHAAVDTDGVPVEYEAFYCRHCDVDWQMTSRTPGPDLSAFEFDGDDAL